MKTDEITRGALRVSQPAPGPAAASPDSGPDALLALNDDALARFDALLDRHHAVAGAAEANMALLDHIVGPDDKDVGAGLVDGNGSLRDDHHLLAGLLLDDHPNRLAGDQVLLWIGKHCADDLAIRLRIRLHIDKIKMARFRIDRSVGELDAGR